MRKNKASISKKSIWEKKKSVSLALVNALFGKALPLGETEVNPLLWLAASLHSNHSLFVLLCVYNSECYYLMYTEKNPNMEARWEFLQTDICSKMIDFNQLENPHKTYANACIVITTLKICWALFERVVIAKVIQTTQ